MDGGLLGSLQCATGKHGMSRLLITLTAIPPRFGVLHETLHSLLQQRAKVEAVQLYIPKTYRRFEYRVEDIPQLPHGVTLCWADQDYGPATKVLPAIKAYRGQDVNILFCDDDKVYDPDWAGRFLSAANAHPGCCIVEEGGDVRHYSTYDVTGARQPRSQRRPKDFVYRIRRLLSLGQWKPRKSMTSGYVDVLEGWGGVLVRPEFFSDAAFDIPDILWTVDDIWLSGQLTVNGVPIWLNADSKIRTQGNSNEITSASLRKYIHKGHDRVAANQRCVDYFRDNLNIWKS